MRTTVSLSVITLTKNRAALLEKCLASLRGQLGAGDEIIIIDNYSSDNTQSVIHAYQHSFTTRAYKSKLSGYPSLYNFALSKSKKPLIVFFDDDCVATDGYIARIREKYSKKSNFVLQGKTLSLPKHNIFAEISEDHLSNWMNSNTVEGNRLSVIDNRNVVVPKYILKKEGGFSVDMKFGSEDVELGMRLFRAGIPIIYDPLLLAFHNERVTLKEFLAQHTRIAKSHAVLDETLPKEQKISIVNKHTWKLHMRSFFSRETKYLREKRYKDSLYLPFINVMLAAMRIIGYLRLSG
jgi:glycosyltransferase involved in cell wall biosynthesis